MKDLIFDTKEHQYHIPAVFQNLKSIFLKAEYADKAIERTMKANKNWRVRERSFVAETTYDMVRWWRLLTSVTEPDALLSDKALWNLFGTWLVMRGKILPENDHHFKSLDPQKIKQKLDKFRRIRRIKESIPDWMDKLGVEELGEQRWEQLLPSLNARPSIILRVNTLKTTSRELSQVLSDNNIDTHPIIFAPSALELEYSRNVFRVPAFKEGHFEVQDAASQKVSEFLNVEPGQRVIDACAGAGGKSLHLASLMQNKGKVLALDTVPRKLEELRKRASRAGASIIEARAIESTKTVKRLYETADRVLLDVPCSGSGVLRRNPDAKWKMQPEEIERVKLLQKDILNSYTKLAKVGGYVVYATCSIFPSEGEKQVEEFMKTHEGWELEEEKRFWPDADECDGFYMARLKRLK